MVSARSLNKRSTTILIAAVLALGTGLLAFNYLSSVNKTVVTVPMRTVVVASQPISVRTVVTPAMLTTASRPAESVDPDALANANEVAGQIALISIPSGGTISASKIGRLSLGGLTVRIPAGERAISIALDRVKGVADLIEAGDHVDVIAVTQLRSGTVAGSTAATILSNKTVLAMGSMQEAPAAMAVGASPTPDLTVETATLAVTPKEAKTLALADLNATLRLALRSIKDNHAKSSAEPFTLPTPGLSVAAAIPAAAVAAVKAQLPAAKAPTVRHSGPPLIDGDRFVNR